MQQGLDELIAGVPDGLASGADGVGIARSAGGLSADRGRCRLAAPGRRGDPRRAVAPRPRCSASPASCTTACAASPTPICASGWPISRTWPAGCWPRSPATSRGRRCRTAPILLARRLGPAELLDWHAAGIAGVAIEEASPAGHAAILARALGLPAVGGARGMLDAAEPGDEAVVDADEGQLVLRPEAEVRPTYLRALEAQDARCEAGWAALRDRPAVTADGVTVSA